MSWKCFNFFAERFSLKANGSFDAVVAAYTGAGMMAAALTSVAETLLLSSSSIIVWMVSTA